LSTIASTQADKDTQTEKYK